MRDTSSRPSGAGIRAPADWAGVGAAAPWLLCLAAVVIFARWRGAAFYLAWIGCTALCGLALTWQARRQHAADAERSRTSEQNAQLLALQLRFLQDVSHQLRTPITIALGHAELLAAELAGRQGQRDIHVVVGELTRLKRLSERLLVIAASEDPEFLRPAPVALDSFLADALGRWRPTAPRDWRLGQLDPVTVHADPERLRLAVDALLENAVQHTSGTDEIRLSVLRDDHGESACLVIEDTGEGIAPAALGHVFERFRTGPGEAQGTGLGLALVRAVALGHGGEARVRSAPGAGSRFELMLPVTAPPGACQDVISQPAQAGGSCGNMKLG